MIQIARKASGFTLMELLVVILILSFLAAIATPQALRYLSRAKSETAQLQVNALAASLRYYRMDVGEFPPEEQGLNALLSQPPGALGWYGPYIDKPASLVDPWGTPYIYRRPGVHGDFDIFTYGADKKPDGQGEDRDIGSWE